MPATPDSVMIASQKQQPDSCIFRRNPLFSGVMERRKHRRVPASLKSLLRANSHEIEGQTVDLSLGGAKFESTLVVQPGRQLVVKLIVPDLDEPVYIDRAQVQWVQDQTFGVEFLEVRQEERGELEQLIDEFLLLEEGGQA
jgi:hypothetical protein